MIRLTGSAVFLDRGRLRVVGHDAVVAAAGAGTLAQRSASRSSIASQRHDLRPNTGIRFGHCGRAGMGNVLGADSAAQRDQQEGSKVTGD